MSYYILQGNLHLENKILGRESGGGEDYILLLFSAYHSARIANDH